jgi:hypothetical protein
MAFGVPPCTCTPGEIINGHQTWLIARDCPEHADAA